MFQGSQVATGYSACVYIVTGIVRFFGDGHWQSRMETARKSYGNHAVIVQSPQPLLGNRMEPELLP